MKNYNEISRTPRFHQIYFKAKSSENIPGLVKIGDWVTGYLTVAPKTLENSIYRSEDGISIKVDKTTVCQSTGVINRATGYSNLIWEGDIFRSLYYNDGCPGLYVIEWKDGMFYPRKYGKHQQTSVTVTLQDLQTKVCIGNVFDKPELVQI